MKLTIIKEFREKEFCRQDEVEYDEEPACLYERTDEYTPKGEIGPIFGCHVVWVYYNGGKRVATVTITRGNGESTTDEKNRLQRCWPERITIVAIPFPDLFVVNGIVMGGETRLESKAWLRDSRGPQVEAFEFSPYDSDNVFVHPADDAAFDASAFLTQKDRQWITECDAKAKARTVQQDQAATVKAEVTAAVTESMAPFVEEIKRVNMAHTPKKSRNPKGRKPATKAEKDADEKILQHWQAYCKREADEGGAANRKPTLEAFAVTIGKTAKQVEEALDRVRSRRKRRARVTAH